MGIDLHNKARKTKRFTVKGTTNITTSSCVLYAITIDEVQNLGSVRVWNSDSTNSAGSVTLIASIGASQTLGFTKPYGATICGNGLTIDNQSVGAGTVIYNDVG